MWTELDARKGENGTFMIKLGFSSYIGQSKTENTVFNMVKESSFFSGMNWAWLVFSIGFKKNVVLG